MTAEAWPTQEAATIAVDAAARAAYAETEKEVRRQHPDVELVWVPWEEQDALVKLQVRESILPTVWAALEALPDPRKAAWLEGLYCGLRQGYEDDNPYI